MTDIQAPAGRFREALAELPLSARRVEGPHGAIVVVSGEIGWVDAVIDAESAGAIAVVVGGPAVASASDIQRLHEGARVPVVIERALLRSDSAGDAAAARLTDVGHADPRLLVADGSAPRGLVAAVARDAVGWLRILAGDELDVVRSDGELALLETRGGIAATLSVVATSRSGSGLIRVHALGEARTDIEVDTARTRVRTSTAEGTRSAPERFESSARLALRRALGALDAGDRPDDVRELFIDTELAERALAGRA